MNYPFSTKEKYFDKKQQKHIDAFCADLPELGRIHQNADMERRHIVNLFLPRGCITPQTIWCTVEGHEHFYHTPTASGKEPWANIYWKDPDSDADGSCTSMEWLEWAGDSVLLSDPEVTMTAADAKLTKMSVGMKRSMENKADDAPEPYKTKDEKKWASPTKKKKR